MPDDTPIAADNSSVSIDMPNHTPIETPTIPELSLITPADYADKGWLTDIKDVEGLFKLTDSLKSEIGKRPAGIPQNDASTDEWSNFNKSFGVPGAADGYELSVPTEGLEEYHKLTTEAFHKAGLSQRQAAILNEAQLDLMESLSPDTEAQEAEFQKMTTEVFGDRKDDAINVAKSLLDENTKDLPDAFKEVLNSLPNKQLIAITAVLDKIQSKHINADDLPSTVNAIATGMTDKERRAEGVRLMMLPEYNDRSHPGHAEIEAKVRAIYGT